MSTPVNQVDRDIDRPTRRYEEALLLWLRWNDAYQRITGMLFESRQDPHATEQLMDQLDQLRLTAVVMSQELLDSPPDSATG